MAVPLYIFCALSIYDIFRVLSDNFGVRRATWHHLPRTIRDLNNFILRNVSSFTQSPQAAGYLRNWSMVRRSFLCAIDHSRSLADSLLVLWAVDWSLRKRARVVLTTHRIRWVGSMLPWLPFKGAVSGFFGIGLER